jgi:hypothetical protein
MVRAILEVLLSLLFALSGWDAMVPAQLGGYERADGANYLTTSMVRGASRKFPRSPLPIQSSRFAPGVLRYAARGGASCVRGRSCCALYGTSSRHIA